MIFKIVSLILVTRALAQEFCKLNCERLKENGRKEQVLNTVCERSKVNCGPDPQCGQDFQAAVLSDYDKRVIVDLHNELRSKVALGKETQKGQPPAANMRAMSYNEDLAYVAQCWANSCTMPLKHDKCRKTSKFSSVGQNLFLQGSSRSSKNFTKAIVLGINSWYEEVKSFNSKWVQKDWMDNFDKNIGHYTQLVWAETHEVGCGVSYFTSVSSWGRQFPVQYNLLLACNYGPAGNVGRKAIYEVGKAGTKCPKGWSVKYASSLCTKL